MRIVCLSDTHNKPMMEPVPDGDILIHAGDATIQGSEDEVIEFAEWFNSLPHLHKVFVAGNHDWLYYKNMDKARRYVLNLQDNLIIIKGLKIYGSSWQPEFHDWAFGLPRGFPLRYQWDKIPVGTDILVTHTPPMFLLDKNHRGLSVGCHDLYQKVLEIKPKLHVFGHIHEGYGVRKFQGITFVNASICDIAYKPKRKPIVIDL